MRTALVEKVTVLFRQLTEEERTVVLNNVETYTPKKPVALKVHVRVTAAEPVSARLSQVERDPRLTYRLAIVEASESKNRPGHKWNHLGLLGKFYMHYKEWCKADYKHGKSSAHLMLIENMVDEHGAESVFLAIDALFGPPLDWVKRKEIDFLYDPVKWSRFVAPAIVQLSKQKHRSEQYQPDAVQNEASYSIRRS